MKNNTILSNRNGELIYDGLNSHIGKKYRPDTPLDRSFVPYLIMLFCLAVDCSCFIDLFKMISYNSVFMIVINVAGMLFAFDFIPIYAGIAHRRIAQGISKDRFIVWLAIGVFAVAFLTNIALRILTIDQVAPDISSAATDYFGNAAAETSEESSVTPTAIALTVFGIVLPVLTSIGSYFISYLTYNPLQTRKRTYEEMIGEKNDEIRRLDAILFEYDANIDFGENLILMDEGRFEETVKMHRALVVSYCEYVRERLKEHLATPTAINSLSEEHCDAIMERLDRMIAATDKLYETDTPPVPFPEGSGAVITEKTIATSTDVAA